MIFLASLGTPEMPLDSDGKRLSEITYCLSLFPNTLIEHIPLLVEHFEPTNLYTASRIVWCESRGYDDAYRKEDDDSGLFQFIPSTWEWVRNYSPYDIPKWNSQILVINGQPIGEVTNLILTKSIPDFWEYDIVEIEYVQYLPEYNILAASYLAQGMHNYNPTWKDWNSSKWCWGNINYYESKWRKEGF